jgi:hypothetical protein
VTLAFLLLAWRWRNRPPESVAIMAKAAGDPQAYLSHISLIGRGGGAFKLLRGFDKSRHTVPDAVNSATSGLQAEGSQP